MPPVIGTPQSVRFDLPELDAKAASYAECAADRSVRDTERQKIREQLIKSALPFATRLAHRYRGRGEPMEDLEQVARLGLLKSVDRYDPQRGPFTGFAAVTIVGELRRHFRDRTWGVRVPRRMQELSLEVRRASAEMTGELRRQPTTNELAQRLGTSTEQVLAAQETAVNYSALSLNAPRHVERDVALIDEMGSVDAGLDWVEDRLTVTALLCRLPERERRILAMRFYGNCTQMEIAAELGISQMHVSRLLSRALTWLRNAMLSDTLPYWATGGALPDGQLVIRSRQVVGVLWLEPIGEVDRDNAGQLRDALLAAVRQSVREIRLHLVGVPFIDAAGIAAVLVGREAARGAGSRLRLGGAQPAVARALRVAGLSVSTGVMSG